MEIKVFGKSLFTFKGKGDMWLAQASEKMAESKFLPDFYKERGNDSSIWSEFTLYNEANSGAAIAVPKGKKKDEAKPEVKKEEKKITPKGVYELQMLNDKSFKLNTNKDYVDGQIQDFKDKLALIKSEEYDMRRGTEEIGSVLVRMENRLKYDEVKEFYEQYPYTTNSKIAGMLKAHDHLQMGQIAQFLADMPKEAVTAMKEYNKATEKLCGKQAVFWIIADKKDFKKSDTRRDPILLAQSPFGHVWQILGAWDEEMLFLEEL
jgi:hypothetical protein